MSRSGIVVVLAAPILVVGCVNVRYKPDLTLGVSPVTIGAKLQIARLVDARPPSDRERGFFVEISCTDPLTMEGDLEVGVTNAILADFRDNQVFAAVARRIDDPDLILEGKIRRFTGQTRLNWFGIATAPIHYLSQQTFWYIGVPVQYTWGAVDLEISLRKPDGTIVGSYASGRGFEWDHSFYNAQWAKYSLPGQVNRAFGEVVQEIRDKLVANQAALEGT